MIFPEMFNHVSPAIRCLKVTRHAVSDLVNGLIKNSSKSATTTGGDNCLTCLLMHYYDLWYVS